MKQNILHRKIPSCASQQRGIVLFVALIALVAMTLAAIALVRSVDTGNVISGNLAFRQGGMQASDLGVETALTVLPGIVAINTNLTGANFQYYATRRIEDSVGRPTVAAFASAGAATPIDWSTVPLAMPETANGFNVRIVIERLCQGDNNTVITDVLQFCLTNVPATLQGSPNEIGEFQVTQGQQTYYRATVQVTGPRNTVSYVQSLMSL